MTQAALPVDPATAAAHNATLESVAAPGAWWNGADRLAIVRAARSAPTCAFCAERDGPTLPISAEHDDDGELPPIAVEAIHAIRNDSGRLTRRWFDDVIDLGLLPEAYVELVAVTASSVIVDTFAQGMGLDMPDLPEPVDGEPTLTRSDDVEDANAWLPLARQGRANILRSLGLVPSALKLFFGTFGRSYYMAPDSQFALDRPQVELVAARVSAVNECFY
ncbi:MAG: hypothetical protein F4089_04125 [Gammaproteobacteria bacterium]|nr:hypothetical protein [Gammaproteobacteria bacterium]